MEDLPLRERKAARLRQALLEALVVRLHERTLDEITVRELCAEVPCSEPTFFNHFQSKNDLLVYFIALWSVEMAWLVREESSALDAIELIFAHTATQHARNPGIMGEIIAYQARFPSPEPPGLTRAEKRLWFTDKDGIEAFEGRGLDSLLPELLSRAVSAGELPPGTDVMGAFAALSAIFFGAAIVSRLAGVPLTHLYAQQLAWFFAGLRSESAHERRP